MSIILFNPTNEDLTACYSGANVTIKKFDEKGHKVKVEDAKAKHLLNVLGARGLTSLEYGDERDDGKVERQKAEDGRKRNLDFKRRQVGRYNQDNEARKAQQLGYTEPPEQIQEYAKELGVGLITPYQVQDIKNEEIAEMKKQKADDAKTIKDMMEKLTAITNLMAMKGMLLTPEEEEAARITDMITEYKNMRPDQFGPWVKKLGMDTYSEYPIAVQQDIIVKWGRLFEDNVKDPFPY